MNEQTITTSQVAELLLAQGRRALAFRLELIALLERERPDLIEVDKMPMGELVGHVIKLELDTDPLGSTTQTILSIEA